MLRLGIDGNGNLVADASGAPSVDSIVRAVRAVDGARAHREGSVLANLTPIHVVTRTGLLRAAIVSGIPNREGARPREVRHAENIVTLFLARGDCYLLRVHKGELSPATFVSLDYSIAPKLQITPAPTTYRDPREGRASGLNDARLLDVALDRELTAVEQYVAAITMPSLWSRLGGGPVALVGELSDEDVDQCLAFCNMFSDATGRLQQLANHSSAWAAALASTVMLDRATRETIGKLDDQRAVAVSPFAAIPVLERNDKQAKQQPEPGYPALAVFRSVTSGPAITRVSTGVDVAATSLPEKMTNTKDTEVVRSTPRVRN